MYISVDRYAQAVSELSSGSGTDNGFFGLLCILKSVAAKQNINPNGKMFFSKNDVSNDLSSLFSFNNSYRTTPDEQETLLLSEDYTSRVFEKFLRGSEISPLELAIVCLHDKDQPPESQTAEGLVDTFYNVFCITDDAKAAWFKSDTGILSALDWTPKRFTAENVGSVVLNDPEFSKENMISFERGKPKTLKEAGEWNSSSCLQKFKPTAGPSDFAAVLHSPLIGKHISAPPVTVAHFTPAKNIIYYGAPGTGKSFTVLNEKIADQNREVTVFHPEYQYSDFVGYLRPVSIPSSSPGSSPSSISYKFNPGPFTKALVKAYKDPDTHYYLVIEELNRAMAAAVFGELFQLLDRDPDGSSSYSINLTDEDLSNYIDSNSGSSFKGKIKLPVNLSIFATMNSSDQSVMPLDTAFKRRWEFKYLPINYDQAPAGTVELSLNSPVSGLEEVFAVTWKHVLQAINEQLEKADIPEDRLLGQFYLSKEECSEDSALRSALSNKVFMYLWDDVLRHKNKSEIFRDVGTDYRIRRFSDLQKYFDKRRPIFCENIEKYLLDKVGPTPLEKIHDS